MPWQQRRKDQFTLSPDDRLGSALGSDLGSARRTLVAHDDGGRPMNDHDEPTQLAFPQLLLTPRQAGQVLGLSRSRVYELMASGDLESVRIGASRRIPVDALSGLVVRLREGVTLVYGRER
jgi:excisionase family DNA binding protein